MDTTRSVTVTLSRELAHLVETKIASGEYASETDVIRESLTLLQERDAILERWLREEIAAAYDEDLAHPEASIPAEEVMARLRERQRARLANTG